MNAIITISRDSGVLTMDWRFQDGSGLTREVVESAVSGQRRFEETERNDFGEYYVIDAQGNLEIYDQDGFLRTAGLRQ